MQQTIKQELFVMKDEMKLITTSPLSTLCFLIFKIHLLKYFLIRFQSSFLMR